MNIRVESVSFVGLVRKNNEDILFDGARFVRDGKHGYSLDLDLSQAQMLFAVADGMGGHNAGELASEIVLHEIVDSFIAIIKENAILDESQLKKFFDSEIKNIHNLLLEEGIKDYTKEGMGSTFVGFLIYKGKFYTINAGDSRVYRFRDGLLKQLTKDHSYVSMYGGDRVESHMIYNAVGGGEKVFIDFVDVTSKIDEEDSILICSDGLTDMIDDSAIEEILDEEGNVEDLVTEVKKAGAKDNISIIKVSFR